MLVGAEGCAPTTEELLSTVVSFSSEGAILNAALACAMTFLTFGLGPGSKLPAVRLENNAKPSQIVKLLALPGGADLESANPCTMLFKICQVFGLF